MDFANMLFLRRYSLLHIGKNQMILSMLSFFFFFLEVLEVLGKKSMKIFIIALASKAQILEREQNKQF